MLKRTAIRFYCLSILLMLSALSYPPSCLGQSGDLVRVMSFNIRYGTANDGINRWDLRKEFLVETIRNFDPDLLGTQETLASQKDYLAQAFPQYEAVAAGRDDGKLAGEMAALFYRRDRFEPIEQGHFWLSQSPATVGSKGWDAALPRVATWVKLKDLRSPDAKPILFLNAHLDHQGQRARLESCRLIKSQLAQLASDSRWIVTGDFNADPNEEPYRALFDQSNQPNLVDTYRAMHPMSADNEGTFSSFEAKNTQGPRIDWIGCSTDFQVRLARIDRTSKEGRTPSDHFPVTAVLAPTSVGNSLRILSYNIHHGQGVDGALSLERIAKVIRHADADIVALQEVDQGCGRSDRKMQAHELEKLTGYYAVFGKAIDFDGGEYGQAVLSRWPIQQSRVHLLPNAQLANGVSREQRIVLEAIVTSDRGLLRILGTHLDHSKEDLRQEQARSVDQLLDTLSFPGDSKQITLLAGDLNDTPGSKTLGCFETRWQIDPIQAAADVATYPSESPKTRIDYVMVDRAAGLEIQTLQVLPEATASDHRPVLATLESRR